MKMKQRYSILLTEDGAIKASDVKNSHLGTKLTQM